MLGYSSYLDKSMNGIKTLTDGISIIQNGNASFNSITTSNININEISNCDFVNCTTSTVPTIPNNIVNKTYCDSNFCDLTTSQIINAPKTINNTLYFKDINYPDKCMAAAYLSNSTFIIDCKKITTTDLSNPENGSRIKFYVSPKIGNQSDLAFMIQGNYGVSDPYSTQVYVSGALYVANFSYLNHINCGGNFTISASNSIIGLTSLSTSPTYPNSSILIATTAFVSLNFVDKTSAQTIAGIKSFSDQVIISNVNNSTSSTTGALTIQNGGLGVKLNIWCGGNLTVTGSSTLSGNVNITGISTLTGNLNITGSSTITGSLTIPTITTSNRLITSYIETRTNNEIFYNMYDAPTSTVPTTSLLGGYSTQYNNTGSGILSITSYGGGSLSNNGGFEFSYLNSIISKTLISTFYPTQITFYKSLTISGNTITNLSNLSNNPVSTDNSTNIATTAFVNAQDFLTSTTANTTYCNLSTNQTINGEKKFTNIHVESVINLSYTTVPDYPFHSIGYSTYANGLIGHRIVPSGVIYDVLGGGIGIYCGTWLLEYCVTIKPNTSVNIDWLMTGISTSPTEFTNYSGFDNTNFKTTISLAQRTILQQQTIHYTQVFVNTTGNMSLFLIGLCNINSGNAYYYNPGVAVLGPYPTPSCYIQATRIA